MSKIEDFRKIASNYDKLADEVGIYCRRLKAMGVAQTTVNDLGAYEISLRNLSAMASENAATLATKASAEQLSVVKEATDQGKEFLEGLEAVKKGVRLINSFVNFGIAAVRGNFESAAGSLEIILNILSDDDS